MMRAARKFEVGSSLLILSSICISLVAYTNMTAAAPPPAVSVLSATTSSSTSASGLPVPPSKLPAVPALDSDGQNKANIQLDSQFTSELQNQALSSSNRPRESGNPTNADNQNAHIKEGESSMNSINRESANEVGETRNVNGEKAQPFVDFPPFSKQMLPETRYQRQRRSYPIPSLAQPDISPVGPSFRFTRPEELELRLDDERDREAFLKLMSIIASNKNNNKLGTSNGLLLNDDLSSLLSSDTDDGQDDDIDVDVGDEDSLAFQRPVASPYWPSSLDRSNEPMDLMSSLLAAEPPRTSSSSQGRYGLGERPLDIGISRRAMSYRDEDDNDGEWMEEAVPLRGSHMKTRRSGPAGNNEFTFNPVKSHFRRYLRAVPLKSGRGLEFMASGGHFGSILPAGSRFNRRRRATPAMATNAFPAIHWM